MNTEQHKGTLRVSARRFALGIGAAVLCFAYSGCIYDVPITQEPTGKVDERLLGDWESTDGSEKMRVRKFDDFTYVVSYDGDLFRAFHSDVAGFPFVSVQEIDSSERKYVYFTWKLSANGQVLSLRVVREEVVPKETNDSESVQKLLRENLQNPDLFGDEAQFTKER